jgi:hypothetical protein
MMLKNPNALRAGLFLAAASVAGAFAASAGETKGADETTINVQQLAVVDRAIEFCGPIDPGSSQKLKDRVAALVKGASADAVVQARASDEYKKAYSTMDSFIAAIDSRNAKVACANTART